MPPFAVILVIGADSNTDGAVAILSRPVAKALFSVHRPFFDALDVGLIMALS